MGDERSEEDRFRQLRGHLEGFVAVAPEPRLADSKERRRDRRGEFQSGDSVEEGLDGDPGLHPRQERSRADMGSRAKGDVIPRPGAIELELIGVGVDAFVSVRRGDAVKQPISLLDQHPIDLYVFGAGSGQ